MAAREPTIEDVLYSLQRAINLHPGDIAIYPHEVTGYAFTPGSDCGVLFLEVCNKDTDRRRTYRIAVERIS